MRYQKPLKRAARWDQSRSCSSIRLATALKRVLGGQKLRLQKKFELMGKTNCHVNFNVTLYPNEKS